MTTNDSLGDNTAGVCTNQYGTWGGLQFLSLQNHIHQHPEKAQLGWVSSEDNIHVSWQYLIVDEIGFLVHCVELTHKQPLTENVTIYLAKEALCNCMQASHCNNCSAQCTSHLTTNLYYKHMNKFMHPRLLKKPKTSFTWDRQERRGLAKSRTAFGSPESMI